MLYIRTDMNDTAATGHMMRCLAIAEAARAQGEESIFLLADNQAVSLLEKKGFSYIVLQTDWRDMDSELPVLRDVIRKHKIDKILIDSYQVTKHYLEEVTKLVKTVYIDDTNEFRYPVNVLICYANYWEEFRHTERYPEIMLLLGPQYAPLKETFSRCGRKQIKPIAENLLLLSGGTDHYDILNKIMDRIEKRNYRNIDVICGVYAQNYEFLCEKYSSYTNVSIRKAVGDIETYMERADLAVAAGGTTLYELCAFGVPAISYTIAENQARNVKKFHEDGIITYAGAAGEPLLCEKINDYLEAYRKDGIKRREQSMQMQRLIDGKGAWRIAGILQQI